MVVKHVNGVEHKSKVKDMESYKNYTLEELFTDGAYLRVLGAIFNVKVNLEFCPNRIVGEISIFSPTLVAQPH